MTFAGFVLSTGRCGTQWLAKYLGEVYGDCLKVVHEPLYIRYLPRELLRRRDPRQAPNGALILTHADKIERQLAVSPYLECGWPSYGAIPYFAGRFDGRMRVVHLTRHPVLTACSMVPHRYYAMPPRSDHLTENALLTPFDVGVRFTEYRARWEAMTAFEKCLYFWAEIHAFALRMECVFEGPWLRLRVEDLFAGDGLERLLAFLGLPPRPAIFEARGQRQDRFSWKANSAIDMAAVREHPRVVEIAARLGYDAVDVDADRLQRRYWVAERATDGERAARDGSAQ